MLISFFVNMQIPLGVIPKNENNREEIIQIMEILQKYCPKDKGTYNSLLQ